METTRVGIPDPDTELAAQLRDGSSEAIAALYDRYGRLAFGLAYRIMNDNGAAEDVVQDAFLSAWRSARSYDPSKGGVRSWLLTIVRNRAIDRLRSATRTQETSLDAIERAAAADATDMVSRDAEHQEVQRGFSTLPEPQRRTIALAYFGGLTHVEIAQRMGVPLGTVKGRMRMGLEKMRTYLQARGLGP